MKTPQFEHSTAQGWRGRRPVRRKAALVCRTSMSPIDSDRRTFRAVVLASSIVFCGGFWTALFYLAGRF